MRMPIAPAHTTRAPMRCHPDAAWDGTSTSRTERRVPTTRPPARMRCSSRLWPGATMAGSSGARRALGPRRSPRWGSRRGDGLDGAPAGDPAPAWAAPVRSRPTVVALFGPTGIGKTAVAVALAERLRDRRRVARRDLRRRVAALPRARCPHRCARRSPIRRDWSTGWSACCRSPRMRRRASTHGSRTPRSTGPSTRAGARSWSAGPASTCAPHSPTSTSAAAGARRPRPLDGPPRRGGRAGAARAARDARSGRGGRGVARTDGRRVVRALELLDSGATTPRRSGRSSCGRPTRAVRRSSSRS